MINIYEAQESNKRKSYLVVIFFVLFVTLATYVIANALGIYMGYEPGGLGFTGIAFILSGIMSLGGYYYSDKIVLTLSSAKPADRNKNFNFYTSAENLCL